MNCSPGEGGGLIGVWGVPRNLTQSLSGSHDALLLEAMRVLDERSDGPEDAENDEKGNVELSRGSAAAILELIYARRRQERWLTRTRRILISLAAVTGHDPYLGFSSFEAIWGIGG